MTRVSDLVVVGQRGIGSSVPDTRCTESAAGDLSGLEPEARWEAVRDACRACRTFWEQQGYDLRGLNVIEAAADVDDVRRHLGYERITLWGGSFGSHWGMAVMRYFPEGVARAVLHGMEGPDHTYDMPSGVLGALKRMAAEAEEHVPGLRERLPEGGLIEALWILAESLDEEGVEVEVGGREEPLLFDGEALRDCALGVTARVNSRRGARTWAADVLELFEGNFERAAQTVARQGDGGSRGLPTASFFMLDCGSGISLARWDTLSNDPAAQIVGRLGEWYHETCKAWDSDLGDAFRAGFTTDIPTVIVHGTWDVSTPFDNALELLGTFEQHTFVVVEGGTHGALREAMDFSSEFSDALFEFVVSGDRSGLPKEIRFPPIEWAGPR